MLSSKEPSYDLNGFVQFVFDNADFNVHTLDGHNTFHSMGGIACVTPAGTTSDNTPVTRTLNIPAAEIVGSFGKVPIRSYTKPPVSGLKSITVEDLSSSTVEPQSLKLAKFLDTLWLAGIVTEVSPRPSWSGYMEVAMSEGSYDKSRIEVLPFINMDPTKPSTIYTALHFAQKECEKHGILTCPVTFDQPLYIKAAEIVSVSNDLAKVFIRLGGFHLLMSYMGSIGNIMSGSGIEELWETVYAKGSIVHMMIGHAYSRALRANFLTQAALTHMLLRTECCMDDVDSERIRTLYASLLHGKHDHDELLDEQSLQQIVNLISEMCDKSSNSNRTDKLWIQYHHQVSLMRMFIRAERTGDWPLHLHCIILMLPHFHAAGHLAYAKSAHLYVQQMTALQDTMPPDAYKQYTEKGYFTIRRSDKFWAGIFSDQTIEQFLMRQLKTSGGMTRGRGITDSTLAKWVHALPRCLPICNALETVTAVHTQTTEQHKDLRPASEVRDTADLKRFTEWMDAHPPFAERDPDVLVNIATGIVADATVNCDTAVQIGQLAMATMTGKNYAEVTLRRKDKVKSLASMKNTINIRGEDVVVNPSLLFNRITCILNTSTELDTFLQYELAPQPPSLFLDGQMRKTTKSVLGTMLKSLVVGQKNVPDDATFVLDGGHLLHSVVWPQPATYMEVCESYTAYVLHHYKEGTTVVFDGYDGAASTKSVEQQRRSKSCSSADIMVSPNLPTTTSQNAFLGNSNNKKRLIQTLTPILHNAGINVKQAESDADTLIVQTAIDMSTVIDTPVLVAGTDTDLLVMLVARSTSSPELYMLCQGKQPTLFSITELQAALGTLAKHMLFIHAVTGCDTTSALYNQGKRKALKISRSISDLHTHMDVFNEESSTHEDVSHAGEKFLLALYGAQKFASLDKYRHIAYKRGVARTSLSGTFQLSSLPPTSAAARQHSYRVYLQVQEWMGCKLNPVDWGWKLDDQLLRPIPTDQPAAPHKLMNFVTCACKSGCAKACGCKKAGMTCSEMCVNCMGACFNAPSIVEDTRSTD